MNNPIDASDIIKGVGGAEGTKVVQSGIVAYFSPRHKVVEVPGEKNLSALMPEKIAILTNTIISQKFSEAPQLMFGPKVTLKNAIMTGVDLTLEQVKRIS